MENTTTAPQIASLLDRVEALMERNEALTKENAALRARIDALVRRLFGAKSEKLDAAQLLLLLEERPEPGKSPEPVDTESPRCSKPASTPCEEKGSRDRKPRLPEHLPVVEEIIEPEPVKACPDAWRCIGQEISESLDYEPARFFRRRLIRPKYVRRKIGGGPEVALEQMLNAPIIVPLPASLQERCIAAPGLLAQIVVAKYCDHLPLYRQEQIYKTRHDVWLPRNSMTRWLGMVADWLQPLYQAIGRTVLESGYVQVDETPIKFLEPGNGKASQGYLWTYHRPENGNGGDVFFDWQTGRAASCLEKVIPADFGAHGAERAAILQCDGYSAYPAFIHRHNARNQATVKQAGCWAHVRRKFFDAREQTPRVAGWLLRQIQALYEIEKELRESRAGPRYRTIRRMCESAPIVRRLRRALEKLKTKNKFLPQSPMGIATDYALGQWSGLEIWLEDGRIEIDNNLVENAVRPTAVGKKNWLFIGEAGAGDRAAIFYTIVESCRRRGIDPYAYLRDVLTRLPHATNHNVHELTPANWAKARSLARTIIDQAKAA